MMDNNQHKCVSLSEAPVPCRLYSLLLCTTLVPLCIEELRQLLERAASSSKDHMPVNRAALMGLGAVVDQHENHAKNRENPTIVNFEQMIFAIFCVVVQVPVQCELDQQ